jgi:hypothetical protein
MLLKYFLADLIGPFINAAGYHGIELFAVRDCINDRLGVREDFEIRGNGVGAHTLIFRGRGQRVNNEINGERALTL